MHVEDEILLNTKITNFSKITNTKILMKLYITLLHSSGTKHLKNTHLKNSMATETSGSNGV